MKKYNRIFMIVTDGLGIGEDPRAKEFGDKGANTFYHVSKSGLLEIPTWKKLGIDSIVKLKGYNKAVNQTAYTTRMISQSNAKDTLAGHWEMMGIRTEIPFPTFTKTGFPRELIEKLEKKWGRKIIGNKAASGTTIINELADEEKNNKIIVYTSTDSVMQICGNEDDMGIDNLWNFCKQAREICNSHPEWKVGRIIARPYKKINEKWERTANRHDYAVHPPKETILNALSQKGIKVIGYGKIRDIFEGYGIDEHHLNKSDGHGMDQIIDHAMKKTNNEFIFLNLVDFDSKYGHRRDVDGYAKNINLIDTKLAKLVNAMKDDDLLLITSDHGNDPSFPGSDHTRELIPLIIFSKSFKGKPKRLKDVDGMGTSGNIVAKNFGVLLVDTGEDIFEKLI